MHTLLGRSLSPPWCPKAALLPLPSSPGSIYPATTAARCHSVDERLGRCDDEACLPQGKTETQKKGLTGTCVFWASLSLCLEAISSTHKLSAGAMPWVRLWVRPEELAVVEKGGSVLAQHLPASVDRKIGGRQQGWPEGR